MHSEMDKEMRRLREYVQQFDIVMTTAVQKLIVTSCIHFFSQNKDDGKKSDDRAGVKKKGQYQIKK